jgi:hypothetical protein
MDSRTPHPQLPECADFANRLDFHDRLELLTDSRYHGSLYPMPVSSGKLLFASAVLLVGSGCIDGDVARRDDGLYRLSAQEPGAATRAAQIIADNPKFTPKEIRDETARRNTANQSAAEAEYRKRRQQHDDTEQFLKELSALEK